MSTIVRDEHLIACVDYQVCHNCGFRLMRVETTIINNQHIIVKECPICHQSHRKFSFERGILTLDDESLKNFDIWLAEHGLNRASLEQHYHLMIENFFDIV